MRGVSGVTEAPLARVRFEVDGSSRTVLAGITDDIPMEGVDFLIGNDVGGRVMMSPLVTEEPLEVKLASGSAAVGHPGRCSERKYGEQCQAEVGVVTRGMARKQRDEKDVDFALDELFADFS